MKRWMIMDEVIKECKDGYEAEFIAREKRLRIPFLLSFLIFRVVDLNIVKLGSMKY